MRAVAAVLFFLIICSEAFGQSTDYSSYTNKVVVVTLNDSTEIVGKVIDVLTDFIMISSTALGELEVPVFQIKSMREIEPSSFLHDESIWFDNPMYTRNYLTETAIGLKRGEGFYQNIMLGGHSFSYGISDRFSISGGFEMFSIFNDDTPIMYIQPKLTVPLSKDLLHFGFGANVIRASDGGSDDIVGSIYGVSTVGGKNNNLTVGLGMVYSSDRGIFDAVFFQIGGMVRISKRFMLVADNITIGDISDDGLAGTATVRYIAKKVSVDIGIATDYRFGSLPVLGASFQF